MICLMCVYVAVMLILASQRQYLQSIFGVEEEQELSTQRGAKPSLVEWIILSYVSGKN